MSVFPSHSLWSAIKIPFSLYAGKKKKETVSSPPHADLCFNTKQKKFRQKSPQKINFLSVPHFDEEPNKRVLKFYINPIYEPRIKEKYEKLKLEEKFLELSFEGGKGEFACVPSIKPWTSEELNELHHRYGMENEKATKTTENKNKGRGIATECARNVLNLTSKILNMKTTVSENPLNSKFNEDLDFDDSEFYDCEEDPTFLESDLNTNRKFLTSNHSKTGSEGKSAMTELKLAELYMLELDMNGY